MVNTATLFTVLDLKQFMTNNSWTDYYM